MSDPIRKAGARYPIEDLDLVIWERDLRWAAAGHLYVVLGDVVPARDYAAKRVASLVGSLRSGQLFGGIAAASELISLSAFGLVVGEFRQRPETGSGYLRLERDESLPVVAKRSDGRPLAWHRCHWDHINYATGVTADLADLISEGLARRRQSRAA